MSCLLWFAMFSCDSRRGFKNPVHKRQTCHVPGTGMAHVIPRVGVRERTERMSKLYRQHNAKSRAHNKIIFFMRSWQGRVNLSLCGFVISDHSSLYKYNDCMGCQYYKCSFNLLGVFGDCILHAVNVISLVQFLCSPVY